MNMRTRRRHNFPRLGIIFLGLSALNFAACLHAQEPAPQPPTPSATPSQQAAPAVDAPQTAVPATQPATGSSAATTSPFGEITGSIKSGAVPLPGVTVTAANTLTGKKYVTSTDLDGSFKLTVTGKGRYVVKAEFSAFSPITQEIVINEQNRTGKADLTIVLLSRAQKEAQKEQHHQRQQLAKQLGSAAGRQGMQQLALSGSADTGAAAAPAGNDAASLSSAGLPNAGLAADGGNESVAIAGAQGRTEQNMFDPGEMQDRIADLRDQLSRQGGGNGTINFNGGS